jgi:hypothetical protein
MNSTSLQNRLVEISGVYRRWLFWRDLGRVWWVAVLAGVLLALTVLASGWHSWRLTVVLAALAAFVALGIAIRRWRRSGDTDAVVGLIEREHPRLHGLLLTAAEQRPDESGELDYLQERVVEEALRYQRQRPFDAALQVRLVMAQGMHWIGLGGFVVLFSGLVLLQTGHSPIPMAADRRVSVTPGDAEIERGENLVVMARFHRSVPLSATLCVRAEAGGEVRIPLVRNLNDPVYGGSVPSVQGDLRYSIEFDGGESTPSYQVRVFDFPRLERADARLQFPEYTGLSPKEIPDTRRVSAVEGTSLDYALLVNKPGITGTLWQGTNRVATLPAAAAGTNVLRWHTQLRESQRLALVLQDEAGRTNQRPYALHVDVLTNRPPELKLTFPRGDQRTSPIEELSLQAEVVDDFGVLDYGLAYSLGGEPPTYLSLGQSLPAHQKQVFGHTLALEPLNLQPGDLASYFVWADDRSSDGSVRRTSSDMFFAEIRPFEEIFREGQAGGEEGGEGAEGGSSPGQQLAELQKQIISATWKVRRQSPGSVLSDPVLKDVQVILESQNEALSQAADLAESTDNPQAGQLLQTAQEAMEKAVEALEGARTARQSEPLTNALAAEQAAYQALLKMADREHQVARGQNRSRGSGNSRMDRQLDQLELKQSENRYETERQATQDQGRAQRESLQVLNRLRELAQRQQDLNERLKELQAALQEASTEQQREELRQQLKRLREEQQDLISGMDELNQRLNREENQARMAEARADLDRSRQEAQSAADAMEDGALGQALASGTRAQRNLKELSDELRRQSAGRFSEQLRELRHQARQLAQDQQEMGQQLDQLLKPETPRLSNAAEQNRLAQGFDQQQARLNEVVEEATEITRQAETAEPLLSKQLYETLRTLEQDESRSIQQTLEDLLLQGQLRRSVYETIEEAKAERKKPLELTAELLRQGSGAEADLLETKARAIIDQLREGVEAAARSVVGDDVEGLRMAQRELEEFSRQLEEEITRAERVGRGTNTTTAGNTAATPGAENGQETTSAGRDRASPSGNERGESAAESGNRDQGGSSEGAEDSPASSPNAGRRPGSSQTARADNANRDPDAAPAPAPQGQAQASDLAQAAGRAPGAGRRFFDSGAETGGSGGGWQGPILGSDYVAWSDRLREVEELVEIPELRREAARIRDQLRTVRTEYRRHGNAPQWPLVRLELAKPVEVLRSRIAEELARRDSRDNLAPVDRDPVPPRYSEFVRRYYERLGRSE